MPLTGHKAAQYITKLWYLITEKQLSYDFCLDLLERTVLKWFSQIFLIILCYCNIQQFSFTLSPVQLLTLCRAFKLLILLLSFQESMRQTSGVVTLVPRACLRLVIAGVGPAVVIAAAADSSSGPRPGPVLLCTPHDATQS